MNKKNLQNKITNIFSFDLKIIIILLPFEYDFLNEIDKLGG